MVPLRTMSEEIPVSEEEGYLDPGWSSTHWLSCSLLMVTRQRAALDAAATTEEETAQKEGTLGYIGFNGNGSSNEENPTAESEIMGGENRFD